MFKLTTLKLLSKIAIVVCILGIALSMASITLGDGSPTTFLPLLSWGFLLYASYCSLKLTGYEIYEEDLQKIAWGIYILFAIFILFVFVGLFIGPILSFIIAVWLHWQKKGIEDWMENNE